MSGIEFGDLVSSAGPRDKNLHANTADARAYADALRKKWAKSVSLGEVSFDELMTKATGTSDDSRYLRKIRLYDLLKNRKGWTEDRSYIALKSIGVTHLTNIQDVMVAPGLFTKFVSLFETEGSEWDPTNLRVQRPEMPEGWPWFDRITDIYDQIKRQEEEKGTGEELEKVAVEIVEEEPTPTQRPTPKPALSYPYPSRASLHTATPEPEKVEDSYPIHPETPVGQSTPEEDDDEMSEIDQELLALFIDDDDGEEEQEDEVYPTPSPRSSSGSSRDDEIDRLLGL